ncbi:MAG: 2-phosphosulfolactate phosphatase family protein [Cyanothece sp. SIO1E1]|nr:2-phosphosulfolactate phosphatase family protein [Cyanothece sp. SIO1E1]
MKLFVYHAPELIPEGCMPDCAIVIDVLRATTTIATALKAGAEAVEAFSDIEELLRVSETWPEEKRLRAGERGGSKVQGCDLGNSPLEYTSANAMGRRLFISTTNGTRCIESVQHAATVISAALINRRAVVNYLLSQQPEQVWLVSSGWEGSFSLEDTVCAGAIAHDIRNATGQPLDQLAGNDELVAAIALYRQWQDQLLELMYAASHGQRLLRLNGQKDLEYCAQVDTLDILPMQKQPRVFISGDMGT